MVSKVAKPFALALIVTGIICAFSINAGAAINPVWKFYVFAKHYSISFFCFRLVI